LGLVLANLVTGARIVLALPGYWFASRPSGLAGLALVVALAGLSDLVDGTIARRLARPTRFGAALDPVADGVFYGAVAMGLAVGGAYPVWLALVVVARYLLPVLVGAVLLAQGQLFGELRHTFFGQLSTALIAVLLGGVALLRWGGLPTSGAVLGASVVIPAVTLLAWVELGREGAELARRRRG
jgi:cardiolipin synthase